MKIRTFLGSSDNTVLLKTLSFSPVKPPLELAVSLTVSVTLTTNMMFFFWSRPSDFKSSFKLRQGHFPQFGSLKNLHLPLKITVQEWGSHCRSCRAIQRSQGSSHWPIFLSSQPWKCTVLERVASLCAHMKSLKGRRAMLRELRSDHQKSAQQKQPIMNIEH